MWALGFKASYIITLGSYYYYSIMTSTFDHVTSKCDAFISVPK